MTSFFGSQSEAAVKQIADQIMYSAMVMKTMKMILEGFTASKAPDEKA